MSDIRYLMRVPEFRNAAKLEFKPCLLAEHNEDGAFAVVGL